MATKLERVGEALMDLPLMEELFCGFPMAMKSFHTITEYLYINSYIKSLRSELSGKDIILTL